jgi:hypothetical protein
MPPIGKSCGYEVKYHIKHGKDSITAEDWQHYYACADQIFHPDRNQ